MFEIIVHNIERERRERQMQEDRSRELRLPLPERCPIPKDNPALDSEPRRVVEIQL